MKYLPISHKLIPIICGFLLTFIAIVLEAHPPVVIGAIIQRLENLVFDVRQKAFVQKQSLTDIPIAIIDLDEKSLKAEGRWPWPRNLMAQLVNNLQKQGVVVIAFDMLFPEPELNVASAMLSKLKAAGQENSALAADITQYIPSFDNDRLFANALKQGDNIMGIFFNNLGNQSAGELPSPLLTLLSPDQQDLTVTPFKNYIANIPLLEQAAKHAASIAIIPDDDGIIRRYILIVRHDNDIYPSLALEAIRQYLLLDKIKINAAHLGTINAIDSIQLGDTTIPTDQTGRILIHYFGPVHAFPYFSATDVLHNKIPPHALENMIVFVGTSSVGLGDLVATSINSVYPGVEIHANVAASILQKTFLYRPAWADGAQLATIIFFGVLLSLIFPFLGPFWSMLISIISLAILVLSTSWFWRMQGLVVPLVLPSILIIVLSLFNLAYGFFTETKRRSELKQAFSEYVPSAHIDQIIKNKDVMTFEGEKRDMTVLFMDIRNFTSISEKLTIVELKQLLNYFFTEMTGVIFKNNGTIDKYVGDMVMAFWGAPLPDLMHAQHAVESGMEMIKTLQKIRAKLPEMNLPDVNVGIGLNSGLMNVGDMGSKFRRSYTVLGDAVNLGSRLEGLSKYYKVNMIVGESTYQQTHGVLFRQLDRVTVKGKEIPIDIYEPVCREEEATPDITEDLEQHAKALNYYFKQQWVLARDAFTQLQQKHPDYGLYSLYLARILQFQETPPGANWDGRWEHHEK